MDNMMGLFTSTEGRIGRGRWWMGVVILIVINIVISLLILPLAGISVMPNFTAALASGSADMATVSAQIGNSMRAGSWASLILFLIFAYPSYAVSVKRRHDRDNNGMDVLIFYALNAIVLLIAALGIGYTNTEVPGAPGLLIPTPSLPITLLSFVIGIYGIYLLVVMGFLRGTAGTNSYGPDPLGGGLATARA